jgi:CheY-like chemotaxis protein
LVEDHGDTACLMRELLQSIGHEVEHAGDLAQALRMTTEMSFDLLISDLGLPDGTGVDLMNELRSRGNQIRGIVLSGYGREEDVRRSKQAGFADHLTKPVNFESLAHAVEAAL